MNQTLKLPVGIENFEDIRKLGFYYIDKTKLIEQLLQNWGKVNLFTRPRRFGKTLNMSMLRTFFEIGMDKSLFEGLYISKNKELCDEYMGKYPVIFLSLKGIDGLTFEEAIIRITTIIKNEARRHHYLKNSDKLIEEEIKQFQSLLDGKADDITDSIRLLSELLCKHYGKKTIILIDEYDVPLDKAFQKGYYDEMVELMRGLLGQVLKTNDFLQFAVLTGCLRISKESIFTGLNNFEVLSILNVQYDECFGFTDTEVKKILSDYNLSDHYLQIREWYDGYRFGNTDIYYPWDVIRYCKSLCADPDALPEDFWSNSSGNEIVRRFIDKADIQTKNEIERLISGECIEKEIVEELTYNELDKSIENLWSVLFTTGYLTQQGRTQNGKYLLSIPNTEIRNLFTKKIKEWFSDVSKNDGKTLEIFCNSFIEKKTEKIEQLFGDYLWNTISIRDTAIAKEKKENFYHGILLGLLGYKSSWLIKSNAESGIGYSDILIEAPENRTGIVIELKYAEDGNMDAACKQALKQIEDKDYIAKLKQDGMRNFIKYGVACYKKDCKVMIYLNKKQLMMGDINMGKETFEGKKTHCTIGIIGHRGHGKTTLTDAIKKTLTTREERNISLTSSIEYGAILVVSAIDGIMSQTAEQIMIAHHMGMQHIVVFMNKCDMVDDMEMLELVEMGIRDQLYQCGFVGSDIPFIYGSALKALEDPDGEWGDKIMELMDAVDKYIPDSQPEMDQASSIHTKFTAEVYMLDINEGGRDTGYFDGDRLQFYFKTTDVTGEIQLPIEIDMAMPGETLDITIELIQPIKITEEEPFIIRDDECTVGLGRVATIIE